MKAVRLFVLFFIIGISQVNATGFAHNMNKAQKLLKTKKEAVVSRKAPTPPVAPLPPMRKSEPVQASDKKAGEHHAYTFDHEASLSESNENMREKVVSTLSHWLSQMMLKAVSSYLN